MPRNALTPTVIDRFWDLVEENDDGCWIYKGHGIGKGYGGVSLGKRGAKEYAHRLSYMLFHGPIPEGHEIDHVCHNESACEEVSCVHRRCVNPAHLRAVSRRTNLRAGKGFAGVNSRKTHCPKGHPYDRRNTYIYRWRGRVMRYCKTCMRNR